MYGRNKARARGRMVNTGSMNGMNVNVGACGPQGCGVSAGGANSGFGSDWGMSAYGFGKPDNAYDPYYSWAVAQARAALPYGPVGYGAPGVYVGQENRGNMGEFATLPAAVSPPYGAPLGIPVQGGVAPPGSFGGGFGFPGGAVGYGGPVGAPWLLNNCFPCGPCGPQFGTRRGPRKTKAGIPKTIIQAGASASIIVKPNVVFTGTSLEFPAEAINPNIILVDLKVGANSQMPLGEVPLGIYSQVSTDQEMDMDTCQVGQEISLTIRNDSAQPVTIRGAIDGYAFFC